MCFSEIFSEVDRLKPRQGMTEQYSANIQPGVLAVVKEEMEKKEEQQKKHYHYLSELQKMAAEIPGYIYW